MELGFKHKSIQHPYLSLSVSRAQVLNNNCCCWGHTYPILGTALSFTYILSHLKFPTQQPHSVATILIPLLPIRQQRLKEVMELAQGHTAPEWTAGSNLIPDSKLLLSTLNCSLKLGFRKVKGFVKDHRSGKYRNRARTQLLTLDFTWSTWYYILSLSPLEVNHTLTSNITRPCVSPFHFI